MYELFRTKFKRKHCFTQIDLNIKSRQFSQQKTHTQPRTCDCYGLQGLCDNVNKLIMHLLYIPWDNVKDSLSQRGLLVWNLFWITSIYLLFYDNSTRIWLESCLVQTCPTIIILYFNMHTLCPMHCTECIQNGMALLVRLVHCTSS